MTLSNPRAQRGLQILAAGESAVIRVSKQRYRVKSQSQDGYYDVRYNDGAWMCTCPDFINASQFCKHCWAVQLSRQIRAAVEGDVREETLRVPLGEVPECPACGAKDAIKKGVRRCGKGDVPRFRCRACGKFFVIDNGFSRLRATPKAVVTAFDLWANDVSYRKIARHLADVHGVKVGKSTIERWVHRLSKLIADYAEKCGPQVGEIWHADETSVNIDGKLRWTWNIMDHETRFWLASSVSVTRNVDDARKPIKQAKTVAGGGPAALVTDGQPAYIEAIRRELYTHSDPTKHLVIPPMRKVSNGGGDGGVHPGNNIVERLQGTQRERTKVMRGFDVQPSTQELLDGFRGYFNLARPHMGLGGLTPAEKAGVPIPELDGEGRLMSVLVAAHRASRTAGRV